MKENGKKENLTAKSQSALSFGDKETGEGDEVELGDKKISQQRIRRERKGLEHEWRENTRKTR
jgi:hypothetical protein